CIGILNIPIPEDLSARCLRADVDRLIQDPKVNADLTNGTIGSLQSEQGADTEGISPYSIGLVLNPSKAEGVHQILRNRIVQAAGDIRAACVRRTQDPYILGVPNIQLTGVWSQIPPVRVSAHELHFVADLVVQPEGHRI